MELKTENLVKCYGKKAAVRNVSLTLSEGIYGLLGENGAGKTTLMGLLCGIQQPTHGKITLNGRTIEDVYKRQISGRSDPLISSKSNGVKPSIILSPVSVFPFGIRISSL